MSDSYKDILELLDGPDGEEEYPKDVDKLGLGGRDLSQGSPRPASRAEIPDYSPAHSVGSRGGMLKDFDMGDPKAPDISQSVEDIPPEDGTEYVPLQPASEAMSEEDAEKEEKTETTKIVIGVVVAVVVIFVGIVVFVNKRNPNNNAAAAPSQTVASQQTAQGQEGIQTSPSNEASVEKVNVPTKVYSDTMAIKKTISLYQGSFSCYFEGMPKVYGRKVKFSVTSDVFNKYVEGTVVKINFKATKINNVDYITDIVIGD